jgi:PAS domain S-box-containing protein
MLSASDQLSFAAEVIAMLVAASGLVLVAWRRELTRGRAVGRPALVVGLAVLAGVAFAHGSLLDGGASTRGLARLRLGGALLVVVGSAGWAGGRRSRVGLLAGGALNAASAVAVLAGSSSVASGVVLVAANIVVAVALVAAGERSIAARVAANAAATLLLVVVVLSVALSSVITSSVEHQQLADVRSRSAAQAADVVTLSDRALGGARLVAAGLEGYFSSSGHPTLSEAAAGAAAGRPVDRRRISSPLRTMESFDAEASFAFVDGRTTIAGGRAILQGAGVMAVVRGLSCVRGAAGSAGRAAVVATARRASAVGAFAVCVTGPVRQVGTILAVTPINTTYLSGIRSTAPSAALALVGPSGVIAAVGAPPNRQVVDVMRRAGVAGGAVARIAGGRFVAGVPVGAPSPAGGTRPSLWLIASSSTSSLASTRNSLMRTLFIIALGGTLLALVLAVATGDRITSGLRRLTRVVTDVGQRASPPRLTEPPGSRESPRSPETAGGVGRDEVGVLASAFDAMVGAVDEKNTALRRAADDETRLRNRLEAVVAGMGDALVAVDGRGRITDFNRAAERLTATSAAAAMGARASDVVVLSGDGAAGLRRHLELLDPTPWSGLADLARPDGVLVPLAVSAGAVRGPVGEELGTVLVLRDLRKEQEVERMKTEFLSRVGHELRTPLTGILGYAELLVRRNVPADLAAAWLEEILTAAKRELRIVRLLEFFASWGAGRNVARLEPVDIGGFVRTMTDGWAERMADGDRITCQVQAGLPVLQVDREWLGLALDELIDNAVKYSPSEGAIEVRVQLAGSAGPGSPALEPTDIVVGGNVVFGPVTFEAGAIEIAVADEGVGMTPEETARVFGAFEQADPSDTRRFGGLGLGLAAVVQIVADHGGRVRCRSVPGRGTTLSLWLPVIVPVASALTNAGE